MKLVQEFISLPLRFDVDRLKQEIATLSPDAWRPHPTGFKGNSAVPLISVDGGLNDYFAGPMSATRWLQQLPYVQQVLASFKVAFGRSRLMALDPGAEVSPHCDANYHWYTRARIHVPIVTFPEVTFNCGEKSMHMDEGEAWIFDSWKIHSVTNQSSHRRIHLVADTLGSAAFWGMVDESVAAERAGQPVERRLVQYQPDARPRVITEKYNTPEVMPPSEIRELAEDLLDDLIGSNSANPEHLVEQFSAAVRAFYRDWAMAWTLYGTEESGWDVYEKLRNHLISRMDRIQQPLLVGSTGLPAQKVILGRILVSCLKRPMPGMKTLQFAH